MGVKKFKHYVKNHMKSVNPDLVSSLMYAAGALYKEFVEEKVDLSTPEGEEFVTKFMNTWISKYLKGKDTVGTVEDILQYRQELTKNLEKYRVIEERSSSLPKRPKTAYIYFYESVNEKVRKKYPELQTGKIASKIGEMWRGLPNSKKSVYVKKAENDKARYTKEREEVEVNLPSIKKEPKRKTAYRIYCDENRELVKKQYPDLKPNKITSLLAEEWKKVKLDAEQFQIYQNKVLESERLAAPVLE